MRAGETEEERVSRTVLKPWTAAGLIRCAIAGALLIVLVILAFNGIHQSAANTFPVPGSSEGLQNVILGTAILGILGTFGIIAYYYRSIDFTSKK